MVSGMFDPYYVAEVLADLLSRQWGHEVTIDLVPKDPTTEASDNRASG